MRFTVLALSSFIIGLDSSAALPISAADTNTPDSSSTTKPDSSSTTERRRLNDDVNVMTYFSGCNLGDGFMPTNAGAMCRGTPFEPINDCPADASSEVACFDIIQQWKTRDYSTKVSDRTSMKSHMQAVVNAEGAGWGAAGSMSLDAMHNSQTTEDSISFIVGGTVSSAYQKIIRNPQKLKLSDSARALLEDNPQEWLETYGTWLITEFTYGGAFYGSFNLNSKKVEDSSSLDAFAQMSYSGAASIKGSASFTAAVENTQASVTMTQECKNRGGPPSINCADISEPADMVAKYQAWHAGIAGNCAKVDDIRSKNCHAEPMKMTWGLWSQVEDITNTLSQKGVTNDANGMVAFRAEYPTGTTLDALNSEYTQCLALRTRVGRIMQQPKLKSELKTGLLDVWRKLTAHINDYESFTVARALEVQNQMRQNDFSWFVNLNFELGAVVDELIDASYRQQAVCWSNLDDPNEECKTSSTEEVPVDSDNWLMLDTIVCGSRRGTMGWCQRTLEAEELQCWDNGVSRCLTYKYENAKPKDTTGSGSYHRISGGCDLGYCRANGVPLEAEVTNFALRHQGHGRNCISSGSRSNNRLISGNNKNEFVAEVIDGQARVAVKKIPDDRTLEPKILWSKQLGPTINGGQFSVCLRDDTNVYATGSGLDVKLINGNDHCERVKDCAQSGELQMQDDNNLVLYPRNREESGSAIWSLHVNEGVDINQ